MSLDIENLTADQQKRFRLGIETNKISKWTGAHTVGDLAVEEGWWGICTQNTTTHIKPQTLGGNPLSLLGADMTTESNFTGIVSMQNVLDITSDLYLREIWLWCDNVGVDAHHSVYLERNGEKQAVALPYLNLGWNLIRTGEAVLVKGDHVVLTHEVSVYTEATSEEGTWFYKDSSNGTPASGEWTTDGTADAATTINMSKTDKDGVDFSSQLVSLPAGSVIHMADIQVPGNYVDYRVSSVADNSSYVTVSCAIAASSSAPRVGFDSTCEFSTEASQNVAYKTLPNHFDTNPPFATATGRVYHDRTLQYEDNTAVGIDLVILRAFVSSDWDLLSGPIY